MLPLQLPSKVIQLRVKASRFGIPDKSHIAFITWIADALLTMPCKSCSFATYQS
jgi:hypothetical protein